MQPLDEAVETRAERERQLDLAIADECRINVLWWHCPLKRERALELEVPGLPLAPGLATLFRTVDRLPSTVVDRPGDLDALSPATFDLITLYGRRASHAALCRLRSLLAPSGVLLAAVDNRWWKGRSNRAAVTGGSSGAAGYARSLRRAGFSEVSTYAVDPSLAIPRNLVPLIHRRLAQFEALRAAELGGDVRRTILRRVGLSMLLYPALLFVARVPPAPPLGES